MIRKTPKEIRELIANINANDRNYPHSHEMGLAELVMKGGAKSPQDWLDIIRHSEYIKQRIEKVKKIRKLLGEQDE